MKHSIRIAALLMLTLAPMLSMPARAQAESCLDQLYSCYSAAGVYKGWSRELAEVECSLAYSGCIANKLKFW